MLIPPIALSFWLFSLPTPSDAQQLMTDMAAERAPLKVVTPEIVRVAQTFVTLPMGTERFVTIEGHRYAFVLEQHYHPPGFVGAPNGWHKGVTVYELRASSLSNTEPEPVAEPSQDSEAPGSEPGS